ncbi:NAD+ synthase [Thermodesulfovibrio sp. 3907-1M]|uniref:Glutamine-dependent NAD(+) synthetase n=1 Tax=Thermodesulfovibrio autotrophicus TaxID=3118333 RepID=A0AAU8GZ45_9BACT
MRSLRLAVCQINPIVGDIEGNLEKILFYIDKAVAEKAEIIIFPELAITGYNPEDLLFYPTFIKKAEEALYEIVKKVKDFIVIAGLPVKKDDLYNSAAIVADQNLIDIYHKIYLPNYSVFDEMRYFKPGSRTPVYEYDGVFFSVNICEDIFHPSLPGLIQAAAGAELIINISASPFYAGKYQRKMRMLTTRAYDMGVYVCYLNMVGGQDETVFDGRSLIISPSGEILVRGKAFEEDFIVAEIDMEEVTRTRLREPKIRWEGDFEGGEVIKVPLKRKAKNKLIPSSEKPSSDHEMTEEEEIFKALTTGLRDYVNKNGFKRVCLGLSGGIDSSFVALIAVEALGRDRVIGVFMPSRYTSKESREDVYELVKNLGIELIEISIDELFEEYLKFLSDTFKDLPQDVTEENIQSRIRGNILMAVSNKFGWLVITTGNKSELSVGYATLYGDMAGGYAVIKDVYKTQVYKVARWASRGRIPERVFTKPPSAELKPGQTDQDTLPPYEVLDKILYLHIEKCMGEQEIVEYGLERSTVQKVLKMVKKAEFKRRQAPLGIKVSSVSLGKDWRFPITNRFGG